MMPVVFKTESTEDVENLVDDVEALLCLQPQRKEQECRRKNIHERLRSSPCSGHSPQYGSEAGVISPESKTAFFRQSDNRLHFPCTYSNEDFTFNNSQSDERDTPYKKKVTHSTHSHCKFEPYEKQRKGYRKSKVVSHDEDSNSSFSSRSSVDDLEDPHLLLQKLLSEQSLIHEAVRRINMFSKTPTFKFS